MADADTSADLHPAADVASDSTAAPTPPADTPRRGGRPRAPVSDDPEVEARRAADRERKKQSLLKRKAQRAGRGRRSEPGDAVADGDESRDEATRAVAGGAQRRRDRGGGAAEPKSSPSGWLRQQMESELAAEAGSGRSVSQMRHLALRVLEIDGLPIAQEILADPNANRTEKLRALDIIIKLGAGYINPDLAGGEDVPDLPAPIFTTTDGQMPGEGIVTDENMALGAEDDPDQDHGGPQLAGAAAAPSPIPHVA